MTKSPYVKALSEIQLSMTGVLNPLGFKKAGRTYNRAAEDGIVQVVNFQTGMFPIGDYVIPGIRESDYGRFTVNLGVMLPAVRDIEQAARIKGCVHEYHCEIRSRLGSLISPGEDVWWDLDYRIRETAEDVADAMSQHGLAFLERYNNYVAVLTELSRNGELPFHNRGRSALAGALVCHRLGRVNEARDWFDRAADYAREPSHPRFLEYLAKLRSRCGL